MSSKRILILGNCNIVVFRFRKEIIERLIDEGNDVIVSYPKDDPLTGDVKPEDFNCTFIDTPMNRRGMNPLADVNILWQYIRILRIYKPDVVLAFTVKPDIYGGIVCRKVGVPFIANITGAGGGLTRGGITTTIVKTLYRVGLRNAEMVFFQNQSDKVLFEQMGVKYKSCEVLPGSGVNLEEFQPLPYPTESEPIRFFYISRVMREKGIEEFLEAAKEIKKKYGIKVEFHICGLCEENYRDTLEDMEIDGIIRYHGLVSNIADYELVAHCIVLPSFHPEGVSNVLLESAAMARPIITTDHVGCKETVENGVTGYIVEKQNYEDLSDKIEEFILLPYTDKMNMGIAGRRKVKKEYDRNIVIDSYFRAIKRI